MVAAFASFLRAAVSVSLGTLSEPNMVSLEREIKEAPPAPIPNPIMIADQQKLSRKRSSCPNLKMYVKDQNGEVRGMDVDLSPTMDLPGGTMDVEASYIEEKCCFLVPNGFMSGKKGGRRSSESSAEVRKVFLQKVLKVCTPSDYWQTLNPIPIYVLG